MILESVITGVDIQRHTRTAPQRSARLSLIVVVGLLGVLIAGCTRPADRPLDGARPGSVASAKDLLVSASPASIGTTPEAEEPPPPAGSPVVAPAASPTVTGRGPIISTIQPRANANVPVGPVTIAARVSATSDISEVSIIVDGQATRPTATGDARTPTYTLTINLAAGQHQARIQVRDDQGRLGGYSWNFTVGAPPAPAASPAARR